MKLWLVAFGAIALVQPAGAGEPRLPQIVGHRGLIHHAPENTLAAFSACFELRLGIEVDIRRSRDGALICLHDETLERTTDGKGMARLLTLAELRRLDAGRRCHRAFAGEKIPTLEEVLARARDRDSLLAIDIKEEDLEADLVKLVGKHRLSSKAVCIGLTIERAGLRRKLRDLDAEIGIAVLAQTEKDLPAALEETAADWVYLRFVPTREQVTRIHKLDKKVFIAGPTVAGMEKENWARCRDAGVDALLTDYPLECRRSWRP